MDGARENVIRLCREQLEYDMFSDQMLVGMLIMFISRIMREDQDVMESSSSKVKTAGKDDFQVLQYMQSNLADVTLQDVADHFGFSAAYCSRLIKSSTGRASTSGNAPCG